MKGLIFSIKRYSVHDGPGIRVTFFMKGCPLSCWWCHNPEGISPSQETVEKVQKAGGKEFRTLENVGRYITPADVLAVLEKEKIFIAESGGGVTFSGGEPLTQPEFLIEALKRCKAGGYHTAVDTSGYSDTVTLGKIIPFTDLFLFDLKHLVSEQHLKYTGVSNELPVGNLHFIIESGKEVWLRIPVIPGINDDHGHLEMLKDFISGVGNGRLKKINLLPYHRIGTSKYKRFGLPYRMQNTASPTPARMKELKAYFEETGIKVKIGG
ncbi:MAG: glycyl-radical enzyme activating protein [Bacteroidales bacterium]|nr:glycyl-radical enzyme activating protein [Bacteroidales bacterium]